MEANNGVSSGHSTVRIPPKISDGSGSEKSMVRIPPKRGSVQKNCIKTIAKAVVSRLPACGAQVAPDPAPFPPRSE
ncbi:hypothetical protein AAC387_Pa11g1884 [Persea americana]